MSETVPPGTIVEAKGFIYRRNGGHRCTSDAIMPGTSGEVQETNGDGTLEVLFDLGKDAWGNGETKQRTVSHDQITTL